MCQQDNAKEQILWDRLAGFAAKVATDAKGHLIWKRPSQIHQALERLAQPTTRQQNKTRAQYNSRENEISALVNGSVRIANDNYSSVITLCDICNDH